MFNLQPTFRPQSVPSHWRPPRPYLSSTYPGCPLFGTIWEFPKIGGTSLGVPIRRTIVFLGLYWGPLILGNYHIPLFEGSRIVLADRADLLTPVFLRAQSPLRGIWEISGDLI